MRNEMSGQFNLKKNRLRDRCWRKYISNINRYYMVSIWTKSRLRLVEGGGTILDNWISAIIEIADLLKCLD